MSHAIDAENLGIGKDIALRIRKEMVDVGEPMSVYSWWRKESQRYTNAKESQKWPHPKI